MQPLTSASFVERTAEGARFVFDGGWQCRIFVLADDLVRVLFIRPEGLREPRTWMVAPQADDVPWEGRDRLDIERFLRPTFDFEAREREVAIRAGALRIVVRLDPFGLEWAASGTRFAADRPTSAYQSRHGGGA